MLGQWLVFFIPGGAMALRALARKVMVVLGYPLPTTRPTAASIDENAWSDKPRFLRHYFAPTTG